MNWLLTGMRIQYSFFLLLIFLNGIACAQTKSIGQGILVTQIASQDTTQFLYILNRAGNHLTAYTATAGSITATAYHLNDTQTGLKLDIRPLQNGQLSADSLVLKWDDQAHALIVNQHDRYRLFPNYYSSFKSKPTLLALLKILSDQIGDYPINDIMPLLAFDPPLAMQVKSAVCLTQRSQADVQDTWIISYHYSNNRLDSLIATNGKLVRYNKKVSYQRVETIKTYRNVEDRQVTNSTIRYHADNRLTVNQKNFEPGKNRETNLTFTLTVQHIGSINLMELNHKAVINLIHQHEKTIH